MNRVFHQILMLVIVFAVHATATIHIGLQQLAPKPFESVPIRPQPLTVINMQMGKLESHVVLRQQGPEPKLNVNSTVKFAESGFSLLCEWHTCNPVTFFGAVQTNITGGGIGVPDYCTSGGAICIPSGRDASFEPCISWSLVGTHGGGCTIDFQSLVENNGYFYKHLLAVREQLKSRFGAVVREVKADKTKLQNGGYALLDAQGKEIASGTEDEVLWIQRVRAAFEGSYGLENATDSVGSALFLLIDYVLESPEFQSQLALASKQNNLDLASPALKRNAAKIDITITHKAG